MAGTVDPRIEAAVGHWAGRFIANGMPMIDFQEVTAPLLRWEDWCAAFSARAELHEQLGADALAADRSRSAGEHLTAAAICYHFAKFLFVHDPDQMRTARDKSVACRQRALPYLDPPGERVEVPFEGGVLPGILRKPVGDMRSAVVVMIMGLDSTKEEMHTNEQNFLDRGIATFAFDGPGQGEAEDGFAVRGDYEAPVAAVIDCLVQRDDIDPMRIGLWGVSLGGYYAPRAAAYEKRVAACIGLSGPYDWAECWDGLPDLTREAFRVRAKANDMEEARRVVGALTLRDAAPLIDCPLLIVAGGRDRIVPLAQTRKIVEHAGCDAELLLIADGGHVVNDRPYRYRPYCADWMAARLGV
jgi:2,6-dihydroxypseudooxynicotine hydrolase